MRKQFYIAAITAALTFISMYVFLGPRYSCYGWNSYHFMGKPYAPHRYDDEWRNDHRRYPPVIRPTEPGKDKE